jgi:hypothetical protein
MAFVADYSGPERACANCMIRPKGDAQLLHCAGCKTPYCTKECQRAQWHVHKLECKTTHLLAGLLEVEAPRALLLSRLYRAMVSPAVDIEAPRFPLGACAQRVLMQNAIERTARADLAALDESGKLSSAVAALRAARLLPDTLSQPEALALAASSRFCSVPITDSLLRTVGIAVVPAAVAPILEHSCAPNCAVTWITGSDLSSGVLEDVPAVATRGPSSASHILVVRTIAPVAEGEPLTYSYVDPTLPRPQRLHLLASCVPGLPLSPCSCAACLSGNAEDYGVAPSLEGGRGAALDSDELKLLLLARDRASSCAYSPRDPESAVILSGLRDLGYEAPAPSQPPRTSGASANAGGAAGDLSTAMRDAVLQREASLLVFVLSRLLRFRAPFHAGLIFSRVVGVTGFANSAPPPSTSFLFRCHEDRRSTLWRAHDPQGLCSCRACRATPGGSIDRGELCLRDAAVFTGFLSF